MIPRNINDVLQKLTNVKAAGQNKWIADCPVMGHSTPAKHLSIENTGTKALVKCFPSGGHTYADICKALGYDILSYGEMNAGRRQLLLPVNDNYICRFPSFLFWSFLLSGLRCWAAAVR